jgi:hypothetical protein
MNTIVIGLDRHRAQITAEWVDTATGEIFARAGGARGPGGGAPVP